MSTTKLIITFQRLRDNAFEAKAQLIAQRFDGNKYFQNPTPALTDINAAVENYKDALTVSGFNQPKANSIAKKKARKTLELLLAELAQYAEDIAKYDAKMLATTGFDLYKKRQPIGMLSKPENVKVIPGPNKGSLCVSLKKIPKAKAYDIQYAPSGLNGSTVWQSISSFKRSVVINDLKSGTEYRVKVAGAATVPERVWSDEVMSYVL